jgi:hypothetical protein
VNLAERGIEQHEGLGGRVDPEDAAGRLRAGDELARLGERERDDVAGVGAVEPGSLPARRDFVDDAFVACRGKDVPGRIDRERPDVLVVGVEERLRRAIRRDLIDLAVRRRPDV